MFAPEWNAWDQSVSVVKDTLDQIQELEIVVENVLSVLYRIIVKRAWMYAQLDLKENWSISMVNLLEKAVSMVKAVKLTGGENFCLKVVDVMADHCCLELDADHQDCKKDAHQSIIAFLKTIIEFMLEDCTARHAHSHPWWCGVFKWTRNTTT